MGGNSLGVGTYGTPVTAEIGFLTAGWKSQVRIRLYLAPVVIGVPQMWNLRHLTEVFGEARSPFWGFCPPG